VLYITMLPQKRNRCALQKPAAIDISRAALGRVSRLMTPMAGDAVCNGNREEEEEEEEEEEGPRAL